jgi:hypothetical protein
MIDSSFVSRIASSSLAELDRAIAILFAMQQTDGFTSASAADLAMTLEGGGCARINRARLKERLSRDSRTIRSGQGYRIHPRRLDDVERLAEPFNGPARPSRSKSFLDEGIFAQSPGYVKNIVEQINVTYAHACFDCTAVMVRRLFETMIVDAFEKQKALSEITDGNGNLFQPSNLIKKLESSTTFSVSRQTKQAAPHLKDVGDWSAHNRRHRARQTDLDAVIKHLRVAASDLLHLSGQDGG